MSISGMFVSNVVVFLGFASKREYEKMSSSWRHSEESKHFGGEAFLLVGKSLLHELVLISFHTLSMRHSVCRQNYISFLVFLVNQAWKSARPGEEGGGGGCCHHVGYENKNINFWGSSLFTLCRIVCLTKLLKSKLKREALNKQSKIHLCPLLTQI